MAIPLSLTAPVLPFPISCVSASIRRYMLFDINIISWLRRNHRILGVLIGTLPQIPQQSVFLGLPLQLMSEEARLLVEKGLAYLVHDQEEHEQVTTTEMARPGSAYTSALVNEGLEAAAASERKKTASKQKAISKTKDIGTPKKTRDAESANGALANDNEDMDPAPSLNGFSTSAKDKEDEAQHDKISPWSVIPSTADTLFTCRRPEADLPMPSVHRPSYALFKHLHARGFFQSPGLRFGCQYMVYPGDPLRFHSHFLAIGADWDEELDLLDLVGGGRLGTGVKKGFLLGGRPQGSIGLSENDVRDCARVFCIEWGGM